MEGKPELNLQKHRSPKISSKYWMRMVMYAVILGVAYLWMQYQRKQTPQVNSGEQVEAIHNVEIEFDE